MPWNLEIWLLLDVTRLRLRYFCHFGQMMVYHVAQIYIYDMWSLAGNTVIIVVHGEESRSEGTALMKDRRF